MTGAGRRDRLDGLALFLIVVCCALWGVQQVAVKLALPAAPPLYQCALRSAGAAVCVWLWSLARGVPLFQRDGTLPGGLAAGVLFAAEFTCIYLGLPHTNASRLVVFLYTSPFVVAVCVPWFVPSERLAPWQVVGLVGAFSALAYAFAEGFKTHAHEQLLGDGLALLAAVLWGLTTLVVRATRLSHTSPEKTLFYQLAVSALLTAAGSWLLGEPWPVALPAAALWSLLFQTVIVAFASYLVWFWLLRHYPATHVAACTFLTPMFGLLAGAWILSEPIGHRILIALACVALGILLVNRGARRREVAS